MSEIEKSEWANEVVKWEKEIYFKKLQAFDLGNELFPMIKNIVLWSYIISYIIVYLICLIKEIPIFDRNFTFTCAIRDTQKLFVSNSDKDDFKSWGCIEQMKRQKTRMQIICWDVWISTCYWNWSSE